MQPAGLAVMIASVGTVSILFVWCVAKVLTQPSATAEHMTGPDLHTPDMDRD
ncbi:MAG: hypothetical protein ACOYK7_03250 [Pirellulales bacterium]|jgi:hypothetical protein